MMAAEVLSREIVCLCRDCGRTWQQVQRAAPRASWLECECGSRKVSFYRLD